MLFGFICSVVLPGSALVSGDSMAEVADALTVWDWKFLKVFMKFGISTT